MATTVVSNIDTDQTILTCPNCINIPLSILAFQDNLDLICSNCKITVKRDNRTGFLDFRPLLLNPQQQQSLLEQQCQDFYANEAFKDFTLGLNNSHLLEAFDYCKPNVLLDIGCGTGGFSKLLSGRYQKYYGFDPSDIPRNLPPTQSINVNIILAHNDLNKPLPVINESVDTISFLASYDHIPNRGPCVQDLWQKLKPGGFMLVNMTNYGFWVKALINMITGKKLFKNEHEHFCVHNPDTLIKEISTFVPNVEVVFEDADFQYIPNLPQRLGFLYPNVAIAKFINSAVRIFLHKILRLKNRGSVMTVIFKKI